MEKSEKPIASIESINRHPEVPYTGAMAIEDRGTKGELRCGAGAFEALFPPGIVAVEWCGNPEPEALSEAESESLGRAAPQRRREFAAGRQCARRALARLGLDGALIGRGADRRPLWPESFVGSIAHTAEYAAAAVAHRRDFAALGLDVERREAVGEHLWRRIAVPAELHWVGDLPPAERVAAATLLFSAKEAIYKCLYAWLGLRLGFQDVELDPQPAASDRGAFGVRFCGAAPAGLAALSGRYRWDGRYVLTAIAVPADAAPRECDANGVTEQLVQSAGGDQQGVRAR